MRVFRCGDEFWRVNDDESLDVRVGVNGEWQRKGVHVRENLRHQLMLSHNRVLVAHEALESALHLDRELGVILEALMGKPLPETGMRQGMLDVE